MSESLVPSTQEPGSPARPASVAYLRDHWYVLCESGELRTRPLSRKLMGTPLVLFRDAEGRPGTLLDRCAHRNLPLSLGKLEGDHIQCSYHGWQYDLGGHCRRVPGLCGVHEDRSRDVPSYATCEQDGYVWVFASPGVQPTTRPHKVRTVGDRGYTAVRRTVDFEATLHATIENALDVPHTGFLHRGLFRGGREPVEITAVVTRSTEAVQVEFLGEPRPKGIAAKLMSPGGGVVTHYDRFLMPSVAEVEYGLGEENHLVTTSICTPVDDFLTRIYAIVSFRLRLPGWLVKPLLTPLAMKIFAQDARILREQTAAVKRFGGERFTSTEIDLIGAQVWRLLRRAEQGRLPEPEPEDGWRKEVRLRV